MLSSRRKLGCGPLSCYPKNTWLVNSFAAIQIYVPLLRNPNTWQDTALLIWPCWKSCSYSMEMFVEWGADWWSRHTAPEDVQKSACSASQARLMKETICNFWKSKGNKYIFVFVPWMILIEYEAWLYHLNCHLLMGLNQLQNYNLGSFPFTQYTVTL